MDFSLGSPYSMKVWVLLLPLVLVSARDTDFLGCETCKGTIDAARLFLLDKTKNLDELYDLLGELCGEKLKPVCQGAIREMGPVVVTATIDKYLSADFLCGVMGKCTYNTTADDLQAWAKNVLASKPSQQLPAANQAGGVTFMHVTDVHFDLDYQPGAATDCGLPLCCRAAYPGTGSAGLYGDYNCDIPYTTLESGVQAMAALKPDFILWTGDDPPHNVWNQSQAFQLTYITNSTSLMSTYFKPGTIPVYPTLGNHGCFPVNIYQFGQESWLTDPVSKLWYPWLNSQAEKSIQEFGGYSIVHPGTNLRIIALNTQACNNLNFWFIWNVTDPGKQIEWLQSQLSSAESSGELVYIIGHIPIGDSDCLSQWGYRYKVLMDRYQYIVRGQFFGHTHNDHIKINRGFFSGEPISVQWITPSMTTYTGLNPSFRQYEADPNTWFPTNYHQYRLNLTNANLNQGPPQWFEAYDFLSEYSLPNMNITTVYTWAKSLLTNQQQMLVFLNNFASGGPAAQKECNLVCRENEVCDLTNGVAQDIWACQEADPDPLNFFLQLLYGQWVYPTL